jgi:hypothetical protein
MAVSRDRELLSQSNPEPAQIRKSITALEKEASYVQKCMNAGLREWISGQTVIDEIYSLVQQLNQKL